MEAQLAGNWRGVWRVFDDGTLRMGLDFTWTDPPSRQEPFDATIEVVAVDEAGNRGPPVLVEVADDSTGCGCTSAPSAHGWPLLLAALGLVRRRRT